MTGMQPLELFTGVLAIATAILAIVTWKLANITEREFRAGRLPNIMVEWPSGVLGNGSASPLAR